MQLGIKIAVSISDDPILPKIFKDKEPVSGHSDVSFFALEKSIVAALLKAVFLWVLFCFGSHALQKKNYVEITLANQRFKYNRPKKYIASIPCFKEVHRL